MLPLTVTSFSFSVEKEAIIENPVFLTIAKCLKWNMECFTPCHPSNSPVAELEKNTIPHSADSSNTRLSASRDKRHDSPAQQLYFYASS